MTSKHPDHTDRRFCQEFTYEGLPCFQKSEKHDALCDWHRDMKERDSA